MKRLEDYVRSIPDFPEEGIIFRDITSILQDADGLQLAAFVMELAGLKGREKLKGYPVSSLICYEGK